MASNSTHHEDSYQQKIRRLDDEIEEIRMGLQRSDVTKKEAEECYRKRNALYSQRKYYRKKLKRESLSSKTHRIEKANMLLRAKNKKLEDLVAQGKKQVELHERSVTAGRAAAADRAAPATNNAVSRPLDALSTASDSASTSTGNSSQQTLLTLLKALIGCTYQSPQMTQLNQGGGSDATINAILLVMLELIRNLQKPNEIKYNGESGTDMPTLAPSVSPAPQATTGQSTEVYEFLERITKNNQNQASQSSHWNAPAQNYHQQQHSSPAPNEPSTSVDMLLGLLVQFQDSRQNTLNADGNHATATHAGSLHGYPETISSHKKHAQYMDYLPSSTQHSGRYSHNEGSLEKAYSQHRRFTNHPVQYSSYFQEKKHLQPENSNNAHNNQRNNSTSQGGSMMEILQQLLSQQSSTNNST